MPPNILPLTLTVKKGTGREKKRVLPTITWDLHAFLKTLAPSFLALRSGRTKMVSPVVGYTSLAVDAPMKHANMHIYSVYPRVSRIGWSNLAPCLFDPGANFGHVLQMEPWHAMSLSLQGSVLALKRANMLTSPTFPKTSGHECSAGNGLDTSTLAQPQLTRIRPPVEFHGLHIAKTFVRVLATKAKISIT